MLAEMRSAMLAGQRRQAGPGNGDRGELYNDIESCGAGVDMTE